MIQITRQNDTIAVTSPYHPDFPAQARNLGGKWVDKTWQFDQRDDSRVRELLLKVYGWSEDGAGDLVTCKITLSTDTPNALSLFVAGRQIARAFSRDSGAKLGDGVVLLDGEFDSGGSRAHPHLDWIPGTTVELRDIPRAAAAGFKSNQYVESFEILDAEAETHKSLVAEKVRLIVRLAEIDKALSK